MRDSRSPVRGVASWEPFRAEPNGLGATFAAGESDDWTTWNAGQMRAAVEYLEHLRIR